MKVTVINTTTIIHHNTTHEKIMEVACSHLDSMKDMLEVDGTVTMSNSATTTDHGHFTVGVVIDPKGFDEVARIADAEGPGHHLIVHNNSSHIHLLDSQFGDATDKPEYRYVASFPYFEREDDYPKAYRAALDLAAQRASRR